MNPHAFHDSRTLTAADLQPSARHAAPSLLGLVVEHAGVAIRIVEVEAYEGAIDPGSHAFRAKTARNEALFGPAGTVYVYFTYGMHHALNLVCGQDGTASGCLVRAGEVVGGLDLARQRRTPAPKPGRDVKVPADRQLARGPGNVAAALGIDLNLTGSPLQFASQLFPAGLKAPAACEAPTDPDGERDAIRLWRPAGWTQPEYRVGPRVGVSGDGGDGQRYPWRFWIDGDAHVSAYRPGVVRRSRRTPKQTRE